MRWLCEGVSALRLNLHTMGAVREFGCTCIPKPYKLAGDDLLISRSLNSSSCWDPR